jgi:GxxExxY protein
MESAYEEALAVELALRGISFRRQVEIDVSYKGHVVATGRLDLLVERRLVLELKSVEKIAPVHVAQMISYLSACGLELGLILNFNVPALKEGGIRRVIQSIYPE